MHEMSLALEIQEICGRRLAGESGGRLTVVGIEVGAFAGVEPENLRFCVGAVLAEEFGDVRCDLQVIPARAYCPSCAEEFAVKEAPFECPACGSVARGAEGGDDLRVSYLEIE